MMEAQLFEGAKILISDGHRNGTLRCTRGQSEDWTLYGHLGGLNLPGCSPSYITDPAPAGLGCDWEIIK